MRALKTIAATAMLLTLALTGRAGASEFIFGAGTHFAFNTKRGYLAETQRPLLAGLGVASFRDDVLEGAFTTAEPDHPLGRQLERLNAILLDRKLRPVLILKGRQLAAAPVARDAPTSPRERDLFANFVSRVVVGTQAYDTIYEIWNEWNMGWRPRKPILGPLGAVSENPDYSPENYVETARAAYRAIKAVNPKSLVLTGSIGDDDGWAWSKRAVAAGLAQTGDGVSVHFYNHCNRPPDRTAENLIGKVEAFHAAISADPAGRNLPIYITEFGWPNDNGPCGLPPDLAAANMAQFALWAPTQPWIKGIWAYELRNSGTDPADREDNFGLFGYDNAPKPAACMYREAIKLSRSLAGAQFRKTQPGLRWLEGKNSRGQPVWVIWTTARDSSGKVAYRDGTPVAGRNLCGAETGSSGSLSMVPLVIEPGARTADQLAIQIATP
ncbi:cellulase family glycosylhydrolase [Bosea sp. ASV33]|uniref:cellulase family glycosylhydrolase n=1 Tax=Bosea sp. ASV33 TaxID=2795106 RepID=UPI0018ED12C3|nr:cellulase family glycosylhydrolase [Bosea sp. ASV33]